MSFRKQNRGKAPSSTPTPTPTLEHHHVAPISVPRINLSCGSSSQFHDSVGRPSISPAGISSPGTENSQPLTPQGSQFIDSEGLDSTDRRTWIVPDKSTFYPVVGIVRRIRQAICCKFDHPCWCWRVTPKEYKTAWFNEWARSYKWLPEHDDAIRKNWKLKCQSILRGLMHDVRQDLHVKHVRPNWMPENVLEELVRVWDTDDFKHKSEVNKTNRASSTGGTQHKGGSIPITEHRRRMAKESGREPTVFEVFKKTHYDEKTGEFADHRVRAVYEDYMRRKESLSAEHGSTSVQSNEEELNLWLEVTGGKNKKGRIYGFGSENERVDDDLPSVNNTQGIRDTTVEEELRNKITELSEENEVLKQNYQENNQRFEEMQQNFSMIVSALSGMGIKLPLPTDTNPSNAGPSNQG